ncbi:MAG TPA: homoserine dehydrogenase [Candidatus Dormibacteraeota bacterium]|nr:homoserine dehydrogenase [Candidatus Dormibacteraeota bacterium]
MLTERRPVGVAILGAGSVGREVVCALLDRGPRLVGSAGVPLSVSGIAVRDVGRAIARGLPERLITDAPAHLVASSGTDVVVELMGGDEPARTLIAATLESGRPVVTANKHVLAHHGAQLEALARRTGASLRFEAAVAGGTPILGPLAEELAANEIARVRGIVNGTTNFILTRMAEDGLPYEAALGEAQAAGYAEADPTGDVEGDDAVNKLVILARLAFGTWLAPSSVVRRPPTVRGSGRPGIVGVRDLEIEGAAALGLTIRLLATASRTTDGVEASVMPTCVASDSPFGWTGGVTNRIEVEGEPIGSVAFAGPGAGGPETSSAVLADILAVAGGAGSTWGGLPVASGSSEGTSSVGAGLERPRPWFAFVPVAPLDRAAGAGGAAGPALSGALADAPFVELADGIAVRTADMTVDEARRTFAAFLPPDVDVTLYPCDAG